MWLRHGATTVLVSAQQVHVATPEEVEAFDLNLRRMLSDRVVGWTEEEQATVHTFFVSEIFLTAARQVKELDFHKMTEVLQKLFWEAMLKEWKAWTQFGAVEKHESRCSPLCSLHHWRQMGVGGQECW